jgi:hypothetical protein
MPRVSLRGQLAESAYYLYSSTGADMYLEMGAEIAWALNNHTRTTFGFASMRNVLTKELEDRMPSFFLAETLMYLYLLFDPANELHKGRYLFSTEGHPLPMSAQIRAAFGGQSRFGRRPRSPPPLASPTPILPIFHLQGRLCPPRTTARASCRWTSACFVWREFAVCGLCLQSPHLCVCCVWRFACHREVAALSLASCVAFANQPVHRSPDQPPAAAPPSPCLGQSLRSDRWALSDTTRRELAMQAQRGPFAPTAVKKYTARTQRSLCSLLTRINPASGCAGPACATPEIRGEEINASPPPPRPAPLHLPRAC